MLASLNSLKRLAALIACAMLLEALVTDETALLTSLNVSLFCNTKFATVSMIPALWIEDPGPSAWIEDPLGAYASWTGKLYLCFSKSFQRIIMLLPAKTQVYKIPYDRNQAQAQYETWSKYKTNTKHVKCIKVILACGCHNFSLSNKLQSLHGFPNALTASGAHWSCSDLVAQKIVSLATGFTIHH